MSVLTAEQHNTGLAVKFIMFSYSLKKKKPAGILSSLVTVSI